MPKHLALQSQIIYQPLLNPITIVGPHLVVPYSVDLSISRKTMALSAGNLAVTNFNGDILFKVKGKFISLHDRRILLDIHNIPILSFKRKLISAHRRWQVFRGDSSHSKDLLFTVKQASIIHFNTSVVEVFLAANKKEENCDFKVSGSWSSRPCTVFAGDTTTIIAQIHKKRIVQYDGVGKETFSVRVFPNVDYAFIIALVMILDEINIRKNDD